MSQKLNKNINECLEKVNNSLVFSDTEKFQNHKIFSSLLESKYKILLNSGIINDDKFFKVIECGNYLEFELYKHIKTEEYEKRLSGANFCKDRFCPMCNWRRQRKLTGQLKRALELIQKDYGNGIDFIFLTLTVQNPVVQDLRLTLSEMGKAFQRLRQRARLKRVVLGGVRVTEILGDETESGYAHPHFHCLLVVRKSYFKKHYISQRKWSQLWKECLRVGYTPVVDVRKIKPKRFYKDLPNSKVIDLTALDSAIIETIKYSAKHTDLLKMSDEDFRVLYSQTRFLRFFSSFGVVKKYLKFDEDDLIDEELSKEEEELWVFIAKLIYQWNYSNRDYSLAKAILKDGFDVKSLANT